VAESNRPNWYLIVGIGVLVAVTGFVVRPIFRRRLNEALIGKVQRMQTQNARRELARATNEYDRWLQLTHIVVMEVGDSPDAEVRSHASEVLKIAPKYPKDWNYGNAIHKGNLALGRLALREGKVGQAGEFLLLAGRTPGSPQLDSFGPNMVLAKELFEKGERQKVLAYFALCAKFWKSDRGQLKMWSVQVKAGQEPEFGPNRLF
jgi:hypothetical protein